MTAQTLTPSQVADFNRDGYVIVRDFYNGEQIDLPERIARSGFDLDQAYAAVDSSGKSSRLMLRNDLPDDIYSAFVRSTRMVDTMETLLDDEVYHFHHKLMLKEPVVGGAWSWHQDYGYWYDRNACLYPTMASAMIAIDRATAGNGCLQVLKGSHHCGRINHGPDGGQLGADPERVSELLTRHDLVKVVLDPGDTVFFHANLLHTSEANLSDEPRWTLICCFNTKTNSPYNESGEHPSYSHLERWPDERIVEIGNQQLAEMKPKVS